jgi:hypothetical protein
VKDPQGNVVQGRTQWRRFAALMVPATALAGAIVFGMANGALAASFAVSGQQFKVSADKLVGGEFVQYGGVAFPTGVEGAKQHSPAPPNKLVAVSGMQTATITNLCQSVRVPVPGMNVVMTIKAGHNGRAVEATDLMLDITELHGDAFFEDIKIGRDASELGGKAAGAFGQSAKKVTITNLKQVAWSTSAGTFTLNDLALKVNVGDDAKECFADFPKQ